jgi:hypothetical protein
MASDRDPPHDPGGVEDFGFDSVDDGPHTAPSGSIGNPPPREAPAPDSAGAPDLHDFDSSEPAHTHAERAPNMLPGRERRRSVFERLFVRLIATAGVVAIGVVIGAIMADNKVQGWIIGLVISVVTVVLSAILWSSRQL